MHSLCLVLHYRSNDVPYAIDTGLFHTIAVLADKYACGYAASHWARVILKDLAEGHSREASKNALLLYPAIIFDLPRNFKHLTKRLVYCDEETKCIENNASPAWDLSEEVQSLLPDGLLGRLLCFQSNLQSHLTATLVTMAVHESLLRKRLAEYLELQIHDKPWGTEETESDLTVQNRQLKRRCIDLKRSIERRGSGLSECESQNWC